MDFDLPIRIERDSDYLPELKKKYKEYVKELVSMNVEKSTVQETRKICNDILEAIKTYYNSELSTAYAKIRNIIAKIVEKHPDIICPINTICNDPSDLGLFYKARTGGTSEAFTEEEMLHIPFNQRGKVQNCRFSINGCPCIYLGKSSYVTWLEMGKPTYNNFYVSGFLLSNSIKVLNLTIPNWEIIKDNVCNNHVENKNFIIFPLVFATSFIVTNDIDRYFKSEYVVSQLITQVVAQKKIDGVAYLSKRLPNTSSHFPINVCLALVTKQTKQKSLHMDVKKMISIGTPYNFSEFQSLPKDILPPKLKTFDMIGSACCTLANLKFAYTNSDFWRLDKYIEETIKRNQV